MQSTITNSYLKEENFQAVQLPYYGGLEMDLFLPDKGVSVNDFVKEAEFIQKEYKIKNNKIRCIFIVNLGKMIILEVDIYNLTA